MACDVGGHRKVVESDGHYLDHSGLHPGLQAYPCLATLLLGQSSHFLGISQTTSQWPFNEYIFLGLESWHG